MSYSARCALTALTIIASMEALSLSRADVTQDYYKDIRIVEDIPRLISLLSSSGSDNLVPAMIISNGLANKPDGPAGFYASGQVIVLDWKNKDNKLKIIPYSVLISPVPRNSQEEGKRFSPYLTGGGLVICQKTKEFEKESLTRFPPTLTIADNWYQDIARYVALPKGSREATPRNEGPLSLSRLICSGGVEQMPFTELSSVLTQGDKYSRASATYVFFSQTFLKDQSSPDQVAGIIDSNPPPQIAYGVALGVAAAMFEDKIPQDKVPKLLQSLADYCKRNGKNASDINSLVQWLSSLD